MSAAALIVIFAAFGAGALLGTRRRTPAQPDTFLLCAHAFAELEQAADPRTGVERLAQGLTGLADAVVVEVCTPELPPLRGAAHVQTDQNMALAALAQRAGTQRLLPDVPAPRTVRAAELGNELAAQLGAAETVLAPVNTARGQYGTLLLARNAAAVPEAVAAEIALRIALAMENSQLSHDAGLAEAAKSDFLAVMSHELKTPLNIVLGYADLLSIGVPTPLPDAARGHLERLRASARELLARIDEILNFARMDSDAAPPTPVQVNLASLVREIAPSFTTAARSRGLEIDLQLEDDLTLTTDHDRVAQIVFNLMANAIRFTREGKVTVSVKRADRGATVVVRDTGVGIAPEHLEHVFEPFWQVNRTATRTVGGLGLGLSTARKVARSIGGDISVSATVGSGSTFTLFVPERDVLRYENRTGEHEA
jgi:signal transduction histidine kinase